MVWCCAASSNPAPSSVAISAPVIAPLDGGFKSAQTFSATRGLPPVATVTSIPRAANCPKESRAGFLQPPPPACHRRIARQVSAGSCPAAPCTGKHFSGPPLTTSRRPAASSNSAEVARRAWALSPPDAASTSCSTAPPAAPTRRAAGRVNGVDQADPASVRVNDVQGFQAPPEFADNLQRTLFDHIAFRRARPVMPRRMWPVLLSRAARFAARTPSRFMRLDPRHCNSAASTVASLMATALLAVSSVSVLDVARWRKCVRASARAGSVNSS